MMESPSASVRGMARRLLALEAASARASDPHAHEAVRVCEKLRISLTRFAGADGFISLLQRALALARAEVPAAHSIAVKADCSLEGLERIAVDSGAAAAEVAVAITAHLLGLLVTFIGELLTLRLLREAWPDASLDSFRNSTEATT